MRELACHKRLFNPPPQFSRLGTWCPTFVCVCMCMCVCVCLVVCHFFVFGWRVCVWWFGGEINGGGGGGGGGSGFFLLVCYTHGFFMLLSEMHAPFKQPYFIQHPDSHCFRMLHSHYNYTCNLHSACTCCTQLAHASSRQPYSWCVAWQPQLTHLHSACVNK